MSSPFGSSALFLLVFAALPLAACSGSVTHGTGGSSGTGGSTGSQAGPCASFCTAVLSCLDPKTCTLADPAAAQQACVGACETGFGVLSPDEAAAVDACIACEAQNPGGQCGSASPGPCDAQCKDNPTVSAAGMKLDAAIAAAAASSSTKCTNGMDVFGNSKCMGGGSATMCTASCCNDGNCTTPDVALQCDTASPANCTCTAGKNKGKTFQSPDGCSGDVWTECNL